MANGNYDYKISTEEFDSSRDEQSKFGATVGMMTENINNKLTFHQPRLGEVYGSTKEEAIAKMEERIASWIKKS